jgi:1-acyl-sn-glycerol-3-phosphate acyltransferase
MAITGTQHAGRYWRRIHRAPVRITLGEPFTLDAGGEPLRRPLLRAMTDEAMYQMAAILPPEYRGIYANLDEASTPHVIPWYAEVREALVA